MIPLEEGFGEPWFPDLNIQSAKRFLLPLATQNSEEP